MIMPDKFTLSDWIQLYELLESDGHLSVLGKDELERLKRRQ
jgi:hypothetical protein